MAPVYDIGTHVVPAIATEQPGQPSEAMPAQWFEKTTFTLSPTYRRLDDPNSAPINADTCILFAHSLSHVEGHSHTNTNGQRLADILRERRECFEGPVVVLRFNKIEAETTPSTDPKRTAIVHRVSREELVAKLEELGVDQSKVEKVFITVDGIEYDQFNRQRRGYHLVLSEDAARFLISLPKFNAFGTSYKSTDYNPTGRDLPIHELIFSRGVSYENLFLRDVPSGVYLLEGGRPLEIEGTDAFVVAPVLRTADEVILSLESLKELLPNRLA